jgi:four helix bundle protein
MNTEERKKQLRKRTKDFAGDVIDLYVSLDKKRAEQEVVGKQLLRSGTSVAANYREASRARSAAEFIAKIELCVGEADESQLWLELLKEKCGIAETKIDPYWNEADELISIFVTMSKNTKKRAEAEG